MDNRWTEMALLADHEGSFFLVSREALDQARAAGETLEAFVKLLLGEDGGGGAFFFTLPRGEVQPVPASANGASRRGQRAGKKTGRGLGV